MEILKIYEKFENNWILAENVAGYVAENIAGYPVENVAGYLVENLAGYIARYPGAICLDIWVELDRYCKMSENL